MTGCFQPPLPGEMASPVITSSASPSAALRRCWVKQAGRQGSSAPRGDAQDAAVDHSSPLGRAECQGRDGSTAGLASLRALKHLISQPQPQFRFSASVPRCSRLLASPIAADVPGALLGRAWLRLPPSPAGSWGSRQGNATLSDLFGLRSLLLIC